MAQIERDRWLLVATATRLLDERRQTQGMSQAALAKRSGLSKSAVSMILGARRRPTDGTLKELAKAVGLSLEDLNAQAEEQLDRRRILGRLEPFVAVGPFADGLLLEFAARKFLSFQTTFLPGQQTPDVRVDSWSDILAAIQHPGGGPAFCLANRDLARARSTADYLVLAKWEVQLRPCFCLIGAEPLEESRRDARTYRDARRLDPDLSPIDAVRHTLNALKGKIILVESETDIAHNTRLLLDFAGLKVLDHRQWQDFLRWPEVPRDEVVVGQIGNTWTAMEVLARGYLRDSVVISGGAPQLLSAPNYPGRPKLELLLTDTDLEEATAPPGSTDFPWKKWYGATNCIIGSKSRLQDLGVSLEMAAELLDLLFTSLYDSLVESPDDFISWLSNNYDRFGGAGANLTPAQIRQLVTEVITVQRTGDLAEFVPLVEAQHSPVPASDTSND